MEAKKYQWFKIPGAALGFSLPESLILSEAKQFVREFLNLTRLPNGTEFW